MSKFIDNSIEVEINGVSVHPISVNVEITPVSTKVILDGVETPNKPLNKPTVQMVREFHKAFGHPAPDVVTVPTEDTQLLRVSLIAEELLELCEALNISLSIANGMVHSAKITSDTPIDMVEAADALADLDYVVAGGNVVFGFPAEKIISHVHDSNMSKLGEDGKPIYREDGKIMKGSKYWKPNIGQFL